MKAITLTVALAGLLLASTTASAAVRIQVGSVGVVAGSLLALMSLGILAGSLVFGPVVDRRGYKGMLAAAAVLIGGLALWSTSRPAAPEVAVAPVPPSLDEGLADASAAAAQLEAALADSPLTLCFEAADGTALDVTIDAGFPRDQDAVDRIAGEEKKQPLIGLNRQLLLDRIQMRRADQ